MRIRNSLQNVSRARRRAAFTLIEMMVVVAIIVALAGLGIFFMAGQADEGNKTKAKADIKSLEDACTTYKLQHPTIGWPNSLQDLLQRDDQGYGPYITTPESLVDPWGQPYQYQTGGLKPEIYTTMPGVGKISNMSKNILK